MTCVHSNNAKTKSENIIITLHHYALCIYGIIVTIIKTIFKVTPTSAQDIVIRALKKRKLERKIRLLTLPCIREYLILYTS